MTPLPDRIEDIPVAQPTVSDDLPVPIGGEPETAIVGPINGRYDLGAKIARGGMGVVYRAHDRLLNRTVAVKVMRGRFLARPDLMRRFLAEARISGRLQHPGIVPVYEVGTLPDGRPFIAMKLIEGQTLARLLRDRAHPSEHLPHYLKVFEAICQSVAYAHQEGVIHRDLKPDNVMVGAFGEVQVMDWGLAKVLCAADEPTIPEMVWQTPPDMSSFLSAEGSVPSSIGENATHATAIVAVGPEDPDAAQTSTGAVFGTVPFMPPEQARGEMDTMGPPGDVFALGAILCQILTGEPPYFGTPQQVKDHARAGKLFGAYVMLDRCGADPAIVLLAKHCLAVNPGDRPIDAGALAEMVNQCLEGLADRAKAMEVGRLAAESKLIDVQAQERLTRKARRLARTLAVSGAFIATLMTIGLGWYAKDRANRAAEVEHRRTAAVSQIEEALTEADMKSLESRLGAGGPLNRDAAARRAGAAIERATTLFELTPNVGDELRERLAESRGRVDEAERANRLTLALENWRTELFDAKGKFDPEAAARRCAETLSAHGFVVVGREPLETAAEIEAHPAAANLRDVLADWASITQDVAERHHLANVLRATGHSLPERWLAMLDTGDPAALADLSADSIPAAGVAVIARRLIQSNQTEAAERLLTRGVRRHPAEFSLNAQLGSLYRGRPDRQIEAIRYLTAALAARPTDLHIATELGDALAMAGRIDEAFDVYRRITKLDTKRADAFARVGDLQANLGDFEAARQSYVEAVGADPNYVPAHLKLANSQLQAADRDAAEVSFNAAIALEPKNHSALVGLGELYLQKNDTIRATLMYGEAAKVEPTNGATRLGHARALSANGDPDAAVKEARLAAKALPNNSEAHMFLGQLLREQKDEAGALIAYRAAAAGDRPTLDAWRTMGELAEASNDIRGAADAFGNALKLEPKNASILKSLARTQDQLNDSGTLETYRRLLELKPDDLNARHRAGRLAADRGDASGLNDLQLAVTGRPNDPQVRADFGEALAQFGRFRLGASELRAARDLLPPTDARREAIDRSARAATKFAGLEARLADIVNGSISPSSNAAWAEVADVASRSRNHAAAAICYEKAGEVFTTTRARHQALAGFGFGRDAEGTSQAQRAKWRADALRTLRQTPATAKDETLRPILLAGFDMIPAAERTEWRKLFE